MKLIFLVIPYVGCNKHFDHYLTCSNSLITSKELLSNSVHVALTMLRGVERLIALPLGLRKDIDKEC